MVPTNPLDRKTTRSPSGSAGLRGVRAAARPEVTSVTEDGPAVQVENSFSALSRAATGRLDAARLAALREAVRSGTYEVDARALAERVVDDALGPEGT
jgi:anti-sigma28 factor (negative regulator of flagellin synthesis)